MTKKRKPPGGRTGKDDEGYPSHVEIFAMTVRHGADYTKRYLNSLASVRETHEEDA